MNHHPDAGYNIESQYTSTLQIFDNILTKFCLSVDSSITFITSQFGLTTKFLSKLGPQ